jgi:hypothetical protein
MEKDLARLNIERFKKLLANETDGSKRSTLLGLLNAEEAKLSHLGSDDPKKGSGKHKS